MENETKFVIHSDQELDIKRFGHTATLSNILNNNSK
jgi:hypothetical protein